MTVQSNHLPEYDAIIVGGGHNGLSAAVHLAHCGWKVAVMEARSTFGGAVTTKEVTLPGFRHDLGAMNLSMFAGSPFYQAYRSDLTRHGLELLPAKRTFASIFRDGTYLGVDQDLDATLTAIRALSDADADAWSSMQAAFLSDAPFIFGLLNSPMPSRAAALVIWRALRERGVSWSFERLLLLLRSPKQFLDRHFADARVKAMMAAWGLHLDFAPETRGGALFPYLESMANQAFGMVIGRGGSDTIIEAMTRLIEEEGGALFSGSPVVAIEQTGARATGVVLADGQRLKAKRAVIANLHPKVLGALLGREKTSIVIRARSARFRAGPATMMIHLALNDLPDWQAGVDLRSFAYIHLAPDLAMMGKVYEQSMQGLLPDEPVLVVGQPTAIDPSRAPDGKHILWVQVRTLPARIKGDAAGIIDGSEWDDIKDVYAERALDLIENHAPGFRQKILARAVHSPVDLERDNPNLVDGDSLAGSHHLSQAFFNRPWKGGSRYRTPISGLYLCGASTWPGAGTSAASGYLLAKDLAAH